MKNIKIIIVALAGLITPVICQAQSAAGIEMSKAKSLWFNTNNAAGLNITPLQKHNDVSLRYAIESGDFKMQQKGQKESDLSFNTSGALNIGGIALWGNFSFDNNTVTDSRYNTNLFNPFREMPYYVADTVASKWKKQSYTLNLKGASPLLWNLVSFGFEADYIANTGAKQNDPRSATYDYMISVRPSFLFKIVENHYVGANLIYENGFERSITTNSDGQRDQKIFVMSGLGNYATGVVGGIGGINPFYYKANKIGGAIQYGFTGKFSGVLDVKYHYKVEDVFQTPTKPQRMGSVKQNMIDGKLQLMLDGDFTHKLSVGYYNKSTDGIEYVQVYDNTFEVQQWVTFAKYIKSNYKLKVASLNYDIFKGRKDEYSWRAGLKGEYSDKFDEYYLPNSTLAAKNIYGELYVKKNFELCVKSKLLAGINLGYNKNISGHYIYTGAEPTSKVVTEFFYTDMKYLTSNYLKLGAEANFATKVSQKMSLFVKGEVQYLKASSFFKDRVNAAFSVGLMF